METFTTNSVFMTLLVVKMFLDNIIKVLSRAPVTWDHISCARVSALWSKQMVLSRFQQQHSLYTLIVFNCAFTWMTDFTHQTSGSAEEKGDVMQLSLQPQSIGESLIFKAELLYSVFLLV